MFSVLWEFEKVVRQLIKGRIFVIVVVDYLDGRNPFL